MVPRFEPFIEIEMVKWSMATPHAFILSMVAQASLKFPPPAWTQAFKRELKEMSSHALSYMSQ